MNPRERLKDRHEQAGMGVRFVDAHASDNTTNVKSHSGDPIMLLIAEILMLGYGLVALFTGKIKIGNEPVYGAGARLAGAIMASVLPAVFCVGIVIGIQFANDPNGLPKWVFAIDLIGVIVGGVLAVIVAKTMGVPESRHFSRNDDYDYEEDEETYRRRRSAVRDDFDDEEPRPQTRRPSQDRFDRIDGLDDDEEPRPRRRRRPADDDV